MLIITTITSVRVSMITIQTIAMIVGGLICSAPGANATIISNGQIIYDDENNKIISKQFSDIYSAIKKKNKNKNKKVKTAITTTRKTIRRQRDQNQQQEEENYSSRVKSLKDFVQLFEEKEKKGQNPRVYVSYW